RQEGARNGFADRSDDHGDTAQSQGSRGARFLLGALHHEYGTGSSRASYSPPAPSDAARPDLFDVRADGMQARSLPATRSHRQEADLRRHRDPEYRSMD